MSLNIFRILRSFLDDDRKKVIQIQNLALIFCLAMFLITAVALPSPSIWIRKKQAYADGLSQEQISASLGTRNADLLIKMTPPVVTNETLQQGQNPVIEFRLFDSNTNKSFSHVTYLITVEKDGKQLLLDYFHAHDGDLRMVIKPSNNVSGTSKVNINGPQIPYIGAYIGSVDSPVILTGPLFSSSGLYHFIVRVVTVDSDEGVLPDDQQHIYDSWFSVGNTKYQQIDINGKQVPIKIISYYDKLSDFKFDNKSLQMQFDMPFNWNVSRINNTSIFVHQEISVPKPNIFTANKSLSGTVNGIDISKDIALDSSLPDKDIIHVMLPKNAIVQLADQVNKNGQTSGGSMKFALQPNMNGTVRGGMSPGSMGNMSMSSG